MKKGRPEEQGIDGRKVGCGTVVRRKETEKENFGDKK
jgi:hypothetical protein